MKRSHKPEVDRYEEYETRPKAGLRSLAEAAKAYMRPLL